MIRFVVGLLGWKEKLGYRFLGGLLHRTIAWLTVSMFMCWLFMSYNFKIEIHAYH